MSNRSMVATLVDQGIPSPLVPDWFTAAEAEYRAASARIVMLIAQEYDVKAKIAAIRHDQALLDADLIARGVTFPSGERPKNADEREAALTLQRNESRPYREAVAQVRSLETYAAEIAAGLESDRDRRSVARRRMEYAIAALHFYAADAAPE